MAEDNKIYKAFNTLLYSWGSDTPPEAIWAANDFLESFEEQYPQLKGLSFIEDDYEGKNGIILEIIKTLK